MYPPCWLGTIPAVPRISQEEWDRRAAALEAKWLEPVESAKTMTMMACLKCGREWEMRPDHVNNGHGCMCNVRESNARLRLSEEEIVDRADRINCDWVTIPVTAREVHELKCRSCGLITKAAPYSLVTRTQCAACSGRVVPPDGWRQRAAERDLEFVDPVGYHQDPHDLRCLRCGKVSTFPDLQAIKRATGCPDCVKEEAAAKRRIPKEVWDQVAKDRQIEWLEPILNGAKKVKAKCLVCGNEYEPIPDNVRKRPSSGCANCAVFGFDPTAPALLYFLYKPIVEAFKIGVTTTKSTRRLDGLTRYQNYEIVKTWEFEVGKDARDIEQKVLRWWRDDLSLKPAETGITGWTETVSATMISRAEILKFVSTEIEALSQIEA